MMPRLKEFLSASEDFKEKSGRLAQSIPEDGNGRDQADHKLNEKHHA